MVLINNNNSNNEKEAPLPRTHLFERAGPFNALLLATKNHIITVRDILFEKVNLGRRLFRWVPMGFTLFNVVRFCLTYLSSFFFFRLLVVGCCSFAGSIYKDYDSIIIDIFGTVRLDFHLQRVDGANFYAIKCRQWGQQLTNGPWSE